MHIYIAVRSMCFPSQVLHIVSPHERTHLDSSPFPLPRMWIAEWREFNRDLQKRSTKLVLTSVMRSERVT